MYQHVHSSHTAFLVSSVGKVLYVHLFFRFASLLNIISYHLYRTEQCYHQDLEHMSSSALSGRNDSENLSTSEIYEHSPSSLLPLLQFHLPASTLVYGSILCASSSAPSDNIKVWSNIPSRIDGLPIPIETDGTVLVQLSSLSGGQLRIFDTLDSHSNDELDGEQLEEGKNRVIRILKEYMGMYSGSAWKVGGLHERWVMAVIDQLADGVDPEREGIWLPPRDWGTQTSADDSAVEGYEVDIGREVDIQAVGPISGVLPYLSH